MQSLFIWSKVSCVCVKYKSLIITVTFIFFPINLFVLSSPFLSETKLLLIHNNMHAYKVRMRLSKTYAIFSHLEFHFPSILRSIVWPHPYCVTYTPARYVARQIWRRPCRIKENPCHSVFQHFMDFLPICASNNIYAFSSIVLKHFRSIDIVVWA